jgi:hypothetical protein
MYLRPEATPLIYTEMSACKLFTQTQGAYKRDPRHMGVPLHELQDGPINTPGKDKPRHRT